MKKILMLMSFLISMVAMAEEIDFKQLDELLGKKSSVYENVNEGMVVEYLESNLELSRSASGGECIWHVVEQVIKVKGSQYFVSRARRALSDCRSENERQSQEWRTIFKSQDLLSRINEFSVVKGLNLEGDILTIEGDEYFHILDLSQSQFSNSIFLNNGLIRKNFLRRRIDKIQIDINPSTKIKI